MKKVLSLGLSLVLILSAFMCFSITAFATDGVWGGTGIESDPYIISDYADLAALGSAVRGGTDYEGCYFKVSADIIAPTSTISGGGIGYYLREGYNADTNPHRPFKGNFDGNNHIITVKAGGDGNKKSVGLFGYAVGGVIENIVFGNPEPTEENGQISIGGPGYVGMIGYGENLTVNNCINYANYSNGTSGSGYGGVVGYLVGGTVTGCKNYGSIVVTASPAGGIVGYAKNADIIDCVNYGIATANSSMGGIVGQITADVVDTNKIEGCVNNSSFTATGKNAGGIAGDATKILITDCENNGALTSESASLAGIVGNFASKASIANCSNSATINGAGNTGGIIGYGNDFGLATDLVNTGNISSTAASVGGIAGSFKGTGVHLVNRGNITCTYQGSNQGCGGIAGTLNGYNWGEGNTYVYESINYGTVTGNTDKNGEDAYYDANLAVGGITGRLTSNHTYIIDSINYGECNVAGLAGVLSNNATIQNSINLGTSPYAGIYYANGGNPVVKTTYYVDGMQYNGVDTNPTNGKFDSSSKTFTKQTATQLSDGTTVNNLNNGGGHYDSDAAVWVQGAQYPELAYFQVQAVETSAKIDSVDGLVVTYSVTFSEEDEGAIVFVALYEGENLVAVKQVDVSETSCTFTTADGANKAKILVWADFVTIRPITMDEVEF